MHEHIGEQLINMKIGSHEKMQTQDVIENESSTGIRPIQQCYQKHQYIADKQIPCY